MDLQNMSYRCDSESDLPDQGEDIPHESVTITLSSISGDAKPLSIPSERIRYVKNPDLALGPEFHHVVDVRSLQELVSDQWFTELPAWQRPPATLVQILVLLNNDSLEESVSADTDTSSRGSSEFVPLAELQKNQESDTPVTVVIRGEDSEGLNLPKSVSKFWDQVDTNQSLDGKVDTDTAEAYLFFNPPDNVEKLKGMLREYTHRYATTWLVSAEFGGDLALGMRARLKDDPLLRRFVPFVMPFAKEILNPDFLHELSDSHRQFTADIMHPDRADSYFHTTLICSLVGPVVEQMRVKAVSSSTSDSEARFFAELYSFFATSSPPAESDSTDSADSVVAYKLLMATCLVLGRDYYFLDEARSAAGRDRDFRRIMSHMQECALSDWGEELFLQCQDAGGGFVNGI